MTKLSVQPLEQGPQLLKVNFGSEYFGLAGYVNCPDIFTVGSDIGDEYILAKGSTRWLKDNSVGSARFMYSLEYMGNEADPQRNLVAIMTELYRVCCDGALIEICCANPESGCRDYDPFVQRSIGEKTWAFFDRQSRKLCKNTGSLPTWEQDERMVMALEALDRAKVNFQLLNTEMNFDQLFLHKVQAGMYPTQESFQEEILAHPYLINSYSFYLLCIKDESHTFVLTELPPYPSFVMRVFDKDSDDIVISRIIAERKAYEENESFLLLNMVSDVCQAERYAQGIRVANIGANIGWYTLLLAKTFAQIKIDAFEPSPRTLEILQQNVQCNALSNQVTIYPCALSQEAGECEFFMDEHNLGLNTLQINDEGNFAGHCAVKTETLDRVYSECPQHEWPDFVVIDTEGHEQKVWDGAKEMFAAGWRPVVFIEFSPRLLKLRGKCTYFIEWLEQYHYQAFKIHQNKAGLSPMSLEELEAFYNECEGDNWYLDVLFVPEYMYIEGDKFVVDEA